MSGKFDKQNINISNGDFYDCNFYWRVKNGIVVYITDNLTLYKFSKKKNRIINSIDLYRKKIILIFFNQNISIKTNLHQEKVLKNKNEKRKSI